VTDAKTCPRCGGTLLWNGKGYSCIACSYHSTENKTPSEKSLPVPKKKKPGEGKK
jgi:hypothetical protein